jgi:hypothetical protein
MGVSIPLSCVTSTADPGTSPAWWCSAPACPAVAPCLLSLQLARAVSTTDDDHVRHLGLLPARWPSGVSGVSCVGLLAKQFEFKTSSRPQRSSTSARPAASCSVAKCLRWGGRVIVVRTLTTDSRTNRLPQRRQLAAAFVMDIHRLLLCACSRRPSGPAFVATN